MNGDGPYRTMPHPHVKDKWVVARVDEDEKTVTIVFAQLDHDSARDLAFIFNDARKKQGTQNASGG